MTNRRDGDSGAASIGFAKAIVRAFQSAGGAAPIVLTAGAPEDPQASADQEVGSSTFLLPAEWSRLEQRSAALEHWQSAASDVLAGGPLLALPPWGRLPGPEPRARGVRERHELALLDLETGRDSVLGALIPASSLANASGRTFRSRLFEKWRPAVVMYGTGLFPQSVSPSFSTAFILLRAAGASAAPVKVFRVPSTGASADEIAHDFDRLLRMQGGRTDHGFVIRDPALGADDFSFDRLHPETSRRRGELGDFGAVVRLADLCTVLPGSHQRKLLEGIADERSGVRLVTGRDLSKSGYLVEADSDTRYVRPDAGAPLAAGDLLIRELHSARANSGLVVVEVESRDLPAIVGHGLIALRPIAPLGHAQRTLLLLFLRSPLVLRLLTSDLIAGAVRLRRQAVEDLSVPTPDDGLVAALEDLAAASSQFDRWSREAQQILMSTFDNASASDARRNLVTQGRTLRQKVDAANLVDDFDHVARTRFPLPIALRWRGLEATRTGGNPQQTHEAVLETFEVLLCFSAVVAQLLARDSGTTIRAVETIRDKFRSGRTGPGLGDWVAVLQEVGGRAFQRLPEDQPLGDVRTFFRDDVLEVVPRLSARRNEQAHLRRRTTAELETMVSDEIADLRLLLQRAMFLCDLPLLHLSRVQFDSIAGHSDVTYRRLMGDHPVVPSQNMRVEDPSLESGSLYLSDHRGRLHLLRPFLVGRECPQCHSWSTFHPDRAVDGGLMLKSLEDGHTTRGDDLRDALEAVGWM